MPAEVPHEGKRKKKRLVKRTKAITPLQAMMLRMAGTCMLKYSHLFYKDFFPAQPKNQMAVKNVLRL